MAVLVAASAAAAGGGGRSRMAGVMRAVVRETRGDAVRRGGGNGDGKPTDRGQLSERRKKARGRRVVGE